MKTAVESPRLFKHPTFATKKKIWGKSQLHTGYFPFNGKDLIVFFPGEICSLHSFRLMTTSRRYVRSLCSPSTAACGVPRWKTPLKPAVGWRSADFIPGGEQGLAQGTHLVRGITSLQSGEQGFGSRPKPTQSLETKLSVHPASGMNASIHTVPVVLRRTTPTRYTGSNQGWLLPAGFTSLCQTRIRSLLS